MRFIAGHTYHIYNQGNNRELLFFNRDNYLYFLKKIKALITPHSHILAWCLMPNHYHLLIRVNEEYQNGEHDRVGKLNRAIGVLQSSYTQAINKKLNRSGSLFRQKAHYKSLDSNPKKHDDYLINCFLYIHQNPLRAGLVANLAQWEFSSYQDYSGIRRGSLCNQEMAIYLMQLPKSKNRFEEFSSQTIPFQFINSVKDC